MELRMQTPTTMKSVSKTYKPAAASTLPRTIPYAKLIGIKVSDELELADKVESGFSFASFVKLQEVISVNAEQLGKLLSITGRTLTRRRNEGKLKPNESERVLRVSRIIELSRDLFEGDAQAANSWLFSQIDALGNKTPLQLSKTEVGAREVEALIHRLEHGVFT